jgi:hypothetical protein
MNVRGKMWRKILDVGWVKVYENVDRGLLRL